LKTRTNASILIVEDDPQQLRLYSKALRGSRLTCVGTGTAALQALAEQIPDLIILDHALADGERGTDFAPRLKELAAHVPIIIISGTLGLAEQLQALQGPLAAHYALAKPIRLEEFEKTVDQALRECGLGETVKMLRSLERAEKIEGNEPERRFTERLQRQHEIINRLRSATERPNVSALAREFNVARKTIQRDLQDLVQRGQIDPVLYADWVEAGEGNDGAMTND
jgi:DNA-binding NtrC family response regulator